MGNPFEAEDADVELRVQMRSSSRSNSSTLGDRASTNYCTVLHCSQPVKETVTSERHARTSPQRLRTAQ